ncbi:hypothetical protein GSM42_05920 [Shimazuella sp. KC615]|uniref:Uncharacterized protein n=1 Tax=Shimazuella alba TaxID=2690964 RepID=A0A6I4VSU1_9BACL|nr:hypothetical protein [Shimazuella alba]
MSENTSDLIEAINEFIYLGESMQGIISNYKFLQSNGRRLLDLWGKQLSEKFARCILP